jgi:hypothetical protein
VLEALDGMDPKELAQLFEKVEPSRNGDSLTSSTLSSLIKYGFHDLHGVKFHFGIEGISARGVNFADADFEFAKFKSVDFSNANLTGVNLGKHDATNFYNSILNTANMPHVMISGERIDLQEGAISLNDPGIWQIHKSSIEEIGACGDCEHYNTRILGLHESESSYLRRGVLLFQEGRPLGYMKLKGEKSFLSLRTVRNQKGEAIFWRGMVYALEEDITIELRRMRLSDSVSAWRKVNVEDLMEKMSSEGRKSPGMGRSNLRFINGSPIYTALSGLAERIERGTEPVVQVL